MVLIINIWLFCSSMLIHKSIGLARLQGKQSFLLKSGPSHGSLHSFLFKAVWKSALNINTIYVAACTEDSARFSLSRCALPRISLWYQRYLFVYLIPTWYWSFSLVSKHLDIIITMYIIRTIVLI
ncbi:hypothetical protein O6H91_06G143300 [Diphasiastrum complanatum]|uniref:Uncharacterized protein n=1 Tax=Diphasiastrum complanatum TaxID=34168 RepID=A0ACC2DJS2_DIPCM|nr:hypothetical protein O6H91_06G143300 [Diphasiastrum complanatum]